MADSELRNLTAQTAMDDTYLVPVSDATSGNLLKATIRSLLGLRSPERSSSYGSRTSKLSSSGVTAMNIGPCSTWNQTTASAQSTAGHYFIGLQYVIGGTPTSVVTNVVAAGGGSDTMYLVAYNIDSEGAPSTLAASWGPFSVSSTGDKTLTSQSTAIKAGYYYWGTFHPTANTGTATYRGAVPSMIAPWQRDTTATTRSGIELFTSDSSPRSDFSAFTTTNPMRTNGVTESTQASIICAWGYTA